MNEIILGLENIAHAADRNSDLQKVVQEIKGLRSRVGTEFPQLAQELSVWESKIAVIWKEPAGRQGIAKHAKHWAEKLKSGK